MSDEPAGTRAQRKAMQRRRIQDSARAVFFRDGFVRANLDEVAEGAGVAKGTLYRYYDSKAELYVSVRAQDGQLFADKMRKVVAAPGVCAPDLIRLWENCLSILAELVERGVQKKHFRDCDPWEVADILWTLSNGIIQAESNPAHRRLRRRDVDLTFANAIDLILAGLGPAGAGR